MLVGAGCTLPAKFFEPLGQAIAVALEPVVALGYGCGAYWSKEQKWPRSMEEIAPAGGADEKWTAMLQRFSEVSFTPQQDGSLVIRGLLMPPAVSGSSSSAGTPFIAKVVVKSDPKETSGWHVEVDAALTDDGKALMLTPEAARPTAPQL